MRDLILQNPHEASIRALLKDGQGSERAAYMLFGLADIESDPWTLQPRTRYVSHDFQTIEPDAMISASERHITWQTDGFMKLLGEAKSSGMVPALVHTHPSGLARFSDQDDRNEAELARTAALKGVAGLISIVIAGDGTIAARLWTDQKTFVDMPRILSSGPRLGLAGENGKAQRYQDRQIRLFGEAASQQASAFRCAIAGCGATGSAVLPLLLRLGVENIVMFDRDIVEDTNLNRLHGARREDVTAGLSKIAIHERTVRDIGLGTKFVGIESWAGDPETWDALKSCDVIFCCTDDHAGRLFLNRFSRFYGIPIIDVGLAMQRRGQGYDLFARVTTLVAGHPCLVCAGHIDVGLAAEQALKRRDPDAHARLKEEAYVLGEGDPSPAVVTFTTEAASMAVNEWLSGLTGFAGSSGMLPSRTRRFHARDDRTSSVSAQPDCSLCQAPETLGRGDMVPFLDRIA
ncbi:hypothetical protein GCM10007853_04430 [Algimonas ampicilliniresistens]|uniref:ThiF family adenylyltransferase n=1 Tax=Algimonas ampicilliniresistens TaxID=1298735 RepID=A0ABQ5V6G6_9PROT|nr:ThiF family adenylyltransferase [Algimonas ampicilliniresistens]GLQ22569.1 hypothetical protein GCM10007853_04430 [Algimonas ampicilliniresistens]